jgi:hypothetical protein
MSKDAWFNLYGDCGETIVAVVRRDPLGLERVISDCGRHLLPSGPDFTDADTGQIFRRQPSPAPAAPGELSDYRVECTPDGDGATLRISGDFRRTNLVDLAWQGAMEVLPGRGPKRLLVVREPGRWSEIELVELLRHFLLERPGVEKVALIPPAGDLSRLTRLVSLAASLGKNLRLFEDVDAARAWLAT